MAQIIKELDLIILKIIEIRELDSMARHPYYNLFGVEGVIKEVNGSELVPGDILIIKEGQ